MQGGYKRSSAASGRGTAAGSAGLPTAPAPPLAPLPHACRVQDVEPWMSGNARGPSTAFTLLYRLCQVRPRGARLPRACCTPVP